MAHHFKEASTCPVCLSEFENPVYLKCGYVCCTRCTETLEKNFLGKGLLCPRCLAVSEEKDFKHALQLRSITSKIKKLQPQLKEILQMNPRMKDFQEDITLDLDTANNQLLISKDLKKVRYGSTYKNRKECAKRFHPSACVLGSSRFTSGRHYWEVHVGSSKEWDIGLCKDSINPRQPVTLCQEQGFWTVGLRNGETYAASTNPMMSLRVNPRLRRVAIFLDIPMKSISFFDVSDGSHIFTFTEIPTTEPFRPFFSPSTTTPHNRSLRICPVVNLDILRPEVDAEQNK